MIGSRITLVKRTRGIHAYLPFQASCYSTQRLTVSDVLKQTQKIRVRKSELQELKDGLFQDEVPPIKKKYPHVKDVESIFARSAGATEKRPRRTKEARPQRSTGTNHLSHLKKRLSKGQKGPSYIKMLAKSLYPENIEFKQANALEVDQIPKLAHNLDRVLFSPGVQFLQDPRTRIFNYDPHLNDIIHIDDFNFDMVQGFVSVSKDAVLLNEATKHGKQFYSSTLSMTLTLHQLYLFLNNYNEDNKGRFDFPGFSRNCTSLPLTVIIEPKGVNPNNGETIYSVSSDKSNDVEILLGAMGHCLEVFLTHSPEELNKFVVGENVIEKENVDEIKHDANDINEPNEIHEPANVYNYLTCGDFLMRSQLDCYDSRLPGNGTFDLKTRAVCAIRHDRESDASLSTYQIWKMKGKYESFEREFNDLIRTGALLKYGFQARIGQMDGIFIAYHNVRSFFGFQYVPLLDIDQVFYRDHQTQKKLEESADVFPELEDNLPTEIAETQFKVSLSIWQDLLKSAIEDFRGTKYEGSPFRLVVKNKQEFTTHPRHPNVKLPKSLLHVYAVPLVIEDVKKLQQFSEKYETSFRSNISNEERHQNLQNYKRELDAFNSKLAKETTILHYTVSVDVSIDGKSRSGPGRHPYPSSIKSKSIYNYQIWKVGKEDKDGLKGKDKKRDTPIGNDKKVKNDYNGPSGDSPHEDRYDSSSGRPSVGDQETSKHQYLQLMKSMSSTLTMSIPVQRRRASGGPSIVDQMRRYSAVGERRKAEWRKLPARQFHNL